MSERALDSPVVYTYRVTVGKSDTIDIIGTRYVLVSSGVLTIYMDKNEVASFKRWVQVEKIVEEPEDPASVHKQINLLNMKLQKMERDMRIMRVIMHKQQGIVATPEMKLGETAPSLAIHVRNIGDIENEFEESTPESLPKVLAHSTREG